MRVAVDAMGGDLAPGEVIRGALRACEATSGLEVLLVGPAARVGDEIRAAAGVGDPPGLRVVDAPEWVEMDEHPVEALRRKKDASIAVCARLARSREADAIFSAGNTGAVVASASLAITRIEGVKRPAIAVAYATETGTSVIMDVGANLVCKPEHLVQYAVMASAYAREILAIEGPRVGALNIGSEEEKGSALVREAARLLKAAAGPATGFTFQGFVEGHDLFRGVCDVVVCEAFVGNAMLKVCEGQAAAILHHLRGILARTFAAEADRARVKGALLELARRVDYSEYGGAPLLGIDGVVIIGHGRSDARAIANGIGLAARFCAHPVNRRIAEALKALPAPTPA